MIKHVIYFDELSDPVESEKTTLEYLRDETKVGDFVVFSGLDEKGKQLALHLADIFDGKVE
jgi:hypothetical protein